MICECVICSMCDGRGEIYMDINGKYHELPPMDDMFSREPCEDCGGSGIIETCYECQDGEYI